MVMFKKGEEHKYSDIIDSVKVYFYCFVFLFAGVFLSLFAGRGAEKAIYLERAELYLTFLIATVVFMILAKVVEFLGRSHKVVFEKVGFIGSFIFDYEKGLMGQIPALKWFGNFWNQIIVGLGVFTLLGFLQVSKNTFFNELPRLSQQVTRLGEAVLEVEPASTTETLFVCSLVGLVWFYLYWMKVRKGWSDEVYWSIAVPSVFLSYIVVWVLMHLFVYSGSDRDLGGVAFFGGMTAILFLATGGIVLPVLFHQMNNLFQYLNSYYADDVIIVSAGAFIFFIILMRIMLWAVISQRKKLKEAIT